MRGELTLPHPMGLIHADVEVRREGGPYRTVRFLVDSGASLSLLPWSVWHALGLEPRRAMRFTLADPEARLFQVERWCFKGSIDNWFFLEGGKPLVDLVRKYVKHIGKESFFELM